ncbi:hypothetical protein Acr_15g0014160 [Actinidia rufa]|uniref:Uncharacterized protein n=1 Tax=Actinidia rufa TaxID=165716 RepID=A0A7J0FXZ8_9ERIC|nr:hypothetical protein Acr_15g0014160 [Actinidia rufa]
MEDLNEEDRLPNLVSIHFAPQNPNAMLNPSMSGVLQNPPPKSGTWLRGTLNPKGRPNQQGGKYQLKEVDDVNARLATMARKLEALEFTKVNAVGSEEPKEVSCAMCETKEHDTISCPVIPGKEALYGQVNAIGHYRRGGENPYSNTYNPGWRIILILDGVMKGLQIPKLIKEGFTTLNLIKHLHHHNHNITSLPWLRHSRLNQSHFQPPPQAHSNTYQPPHKRSLEDTLQQFIQSQGEVNSRVDNTLDDIKSQLTLLTQALTLTEKVQAITVLRSGKTILPIDPKGKREASKVVEGTIGEDRETGEKERE